MCTRRLLVFVAIGLQFATNGIEYAMIFPSVWLYLEDRFVPTPAPIWLGLLVSAYAMSGLFFGPLFGRMADRTQNTRWILLIGNLFTVGGSFMYSLPIAPWFLMLSRFIAGIGGAVGVALMTNITWATTTEERTSYIAIFMAIRQVGLVVGPMFNFAIKDFNFFIGPYHIDKLAAPGVFMAGLSLITQLVFVFFYWDIHIPPGGGPKTERKVVSSRSGTEDLAGLLPGEEVEYEYSVNPVDSFPPSSPQIPHSREISNPENGRFARSARERISSISSDRQLSSADRIQSWSSVLREVGREEIIAILFVCFAYLFNQGALETALTPLTKRLYDFDEIDNSWVYMGCGILIILTFAGILVLTRCCSDRVMFLSGILLIIFSLTWYIAFVPRFPPNDRSTMGLMVAGLVANIVALPLVAASSVSMLTKLVAKENQGIIQGIRRATLNLALIIGPIWTGGTIENHLYPFFGVLLAIYLVGFLMMIGSWNKLSPPAPSFSPFPQSPSPTVA